MEFGGYISRSFVSKCPSRLYVLKAGNEGSRVNSGGQPMKGKGSWILVDGRYWLRVTLKGGIKEPYTTRTEKQMTSANLDRAEESF
jgi:hypothetical protein